MTEEPDFGWADEEPPEEKTPAPIRYQIDDDDRPFLAFRTQVEDGRLLLSLVVDKERQHAFDDVRSMFVDDPRLSVWEPVTTPVLPAVVKVQLVRVADDENQSRVYEQWLVPRGSAMTILPGWSGTIAWAAGDYVLTQDGQLTHKITVGVWKRGKAMRPIQTETVTEGPVFIHLGEGP